MDPVFHFVDYLKERLPGIKLVEKKKSWFMKILGWLCFFNRNFMTTTTTTIGKTIYLPTQVPHDLELIGIIAHEYIHLWDVQREGKVRFYLRYAFPQVMGLFGFVSCFAAYNISLVMFALFFVCFWPSEAPFRREYEQRAYAMSVVFEQWTRPSLNPKMIDNIVDILHGPSYYWLGGRKEFSKFYFEAVLEDCRRGIYPPGKEYLDVYSYLQQEKYLNQPSAKK